MRDYESIIKTYLIKAIQIHYKNEICSLSCDI